MGGAFFCAVWNGARDNVSLDSFRGDFCAPFGIKGHQCLSLGALSKGGFLVGLLCGFWNKMSAVAAQCLLSGCFSRGCAFFAAFDKISKPAKSNSAELCRLFHLLQYCDSGGVIFAGLFRPFVLPPPHRMGHVAAWSFYLPLRYVDGGTMCGLFRQLPILFHWAHCIRRFYSHAKKKAPRDRGARNLILQRTIFF